MSICAKGYSNFTPGTHRFVSEGVLVPDSSCSHASPLVIVPKKEGGIRIAVDYREVNQFLKVSANQLPYQNMLFQQLSGQRFYAKIYNLWRVSPAEAI